MIEIQMRRDDVRYIGRLKSKFADPITSTDPE